MAQITKEPFGTLSDGRKVELYTLRNVKGTEVQVTTYGARLVSWKILNKEGEYVDVLLGYDDGATYEKDDTSMGGIVGRHANRIAAGKIVIDGKTYQLDLNTGSHKQNHIHGGSKGFHNALWRGEAHTDGVHLFLHSNDGDGGYPGNMDVEVTYSLSDDNALKIDYKAVSDKDTICNLTNHSYFNLDGFQAGAKENGAMNQKVQIFADNYTWADAESLPDGRILPVEGTPMDLRQLTRIGEHVDDDFDELKMAGGYDHNWVLDGPKDANGLRKAAYAESDKSGLSLTCYTTQPGVQFYTANFLCGGFRGKEGVEFQKRGAFCLETQFFPNAPANPNFPQPLLKAGDTWRDTTVYVLNNKD